MTIPSQRRPYAAAVLLALAVFLRPAAAAAQNRSAPAVPAGGRDFAAFDRALRALPPAKTIAAAVAGIASVAADDWEKARGAYVWIADHIAYDTAAYFGGPAAAVDAEGVFRRGRSVCAGYAALFGRFAQDLGLEAAIVSGRAKGYSYTPGDREIKVNHDWNAVRLDGAWRLVDSTWGSGYVGEDRKFARDFTDFWFDCPPELFALWHLPEQDAYQLLSPPIGYAEYLKRPYYETGDFERLHDAGFSGDDLIGFARSGRLPDAYSVDALAGYGVPAADIAAAFAAGDLADCYIFEGVELALVRAPLGRVLAAGQTFNVALKTSLAEAAVVNNGEWTMLKPGEGGLAASLRPKAGTLSVNIHTVNDGKLAWWRLLEYVVK
jgi:hypothetical protein